jgi:hypothetical protein
MLDICQTIRHFLSYIGLVMNLSSRQITRFGRAEIQEAFSFLHAAEATPTESMLSRKPQPEFVTVIFKNRPSIYASSCLYVS